MASRHEDVAMTFILVVAIALGSALLLALSMDINARRRGTKAAVPQDPSAAPLTKQTFWTYVKIE
jgi:hypothetical protein